MARPHLCAVGLLILAGLFQQGSCAGRNLQQSETPPFILQIDVDCFASNVTGKGNGCGGSLEGAVEPVCAADGARYSLLACCPEPISFDPEVHVSCQAFLPPYDSEFSQFFACSGENNIKSCCCAHYLPSEIPAAG